MSGGSQHNPNGRQAQLGAGWSPLQLQVASYLARAPQAHMASERGVTWHTPTPPHMYHVPAPSPPDPLQAMKGGAPAVFRHTATPPDLYRHTPTPPDKHLHRHTPSPGDPKGAHPPEGLFPHLAPSREKLRPEDILSFARATSVAGGGGVDLTLGRGSNGAPLALSVRDAPTINSLIARAPRHRVDSLLERLAPQPLQPAPPSVIVPPRVLPTPSPPSSNDDSVDSNSSSKRKRKPERVLRVPIPDPPRETPPPLSLTTRLEPPPPPEPPKENGTTPPEPVANGPPETQKPVILTHARRKTRSGSAETIDDIAAMIASERVEEPEPRPTTPPQTVDKLKSVLASPEPEKPEAAPATVAAAPRRRSTRLSNSEATNVPVESPSEAKPAEPEPSASAEPTAASFVEVENELEKMFAGIEGEAPEKSEEVEDPPPNKRRKSLPTKAEKKARTKSDEPKRKPGRKKGAAKQKKAKPVPLKDAYDSGSNASSGRSRGPYIQIRGPRDSPLSVSVINACGVAGEEEVDSSRRRGDFRNGSRRGLHCSTLGLRYDAATPDATWLCVFCNKGPHADKLGDLFGPYQLEVSEEVWFHAECGVWAPGLVAAGARLWGLDDAVRTVRAERCAACGAAGAGVACSARACPRRVHLPCARNSWMVDEEALTAKCPGHA